MRRLPIPAVLVAFVLAAGAAVGTYALLSNDSGDDASRPTLRPAPTVPPADELAYTDFDDKVVALADLRGTPVVLNFFGSWCVPCLKEMPAFEAVHKALGDKVSFVGLAYNDRPDDALQTVRDTGVTYPVGRDLDGALLEYFRGTRMPVTIVLDADGTVVAHEEGGLTERQLRELLADKVGVT